MFTCIFINKFCMFILVFCISIAIFGEFSSFVGNTFKITLKKVYIEGVIIMDRNLDVKGYSDPAGQ